MKPERQHHLFPCALRLREHVRVCHLGALSFRGAALGVKAENLFLELHQLAPQGVLFSQDAGDHGLGFIPGLIRLEVQE